METKQTYYLMQKEKRRLTGRNLFSFLLEKIQPQEVTVCNESLALLFLPEFILSEEKGVFSKLRNKIYSGILNKKLDKLLANANREMPLKVVEACLREFLKKECAFRKTTKVLIVDKSRIEWEELLEPYCLSLNYLEFLVEEKTEYDYLAERLYEESGLAVAFTEWEESWDMLGKYHIIIDLRKDFFIPVKSMAEGCVYFDGVSDWEKEKRIRKTPVGATYISPLIYLDRALKSTV